MINGTLFKEGESVPTHSNCYSKTCERDTQHGNFYIREIQQQCPHIDSLSPCADDNDSHDQAGCCLTCVPKDMLKTPTPDCGSCSPQLLYRSLQASVSHFRLPHPSTGSNCTNLLPLPHFTQCAGQCGSTPTYSHLIGQFQPTCSCCQPITTTQRHVTLTCEDGNSMEHTYDVAESCQCGACTDGGQ